MMENLYKTYGEKTLFNNISFSISEKERIGLIGVNGTGKSTLLKVIANLDTGEKGKAFHANDFHIEYLPQYPDLNGDLSVLEQIYFGESQLMQVLREYEKTLQELEANPENEGKQKELFHIQEKMDRLNAWEANTVAKTVLTKLGITDFAKKVSQLSGGQQKRVAIAKALIQPADLLLLDEPTNHLDNETIEWLEGFLSQYKGAFIVITHDRYFLNRVTNKMYELDKGKLYSYEGNYEVFLEKKAEREESEMTSEKKRQNLLKSELAWLRKGAKARTTKQKARIQRVHALRDEDVNLSNEKVDIALGTSRLGKKVIELIEVSKSFANEKIVDNLNYLVVPNERLGIIGPNGSGKSTLLNMMAGKIKPDNGVIDIGETVKIGYYTQDHSEMNEDLRIVDYVKEAAEVMKTADGQEVTAEQMLERFLFPRSMQYSYIRTLSGGERRRLYLLRTLMSEPNVLFLDEPTNDLDTKTLSILEDYLNQFSGVVITVSHDRYFLDRVVDHLICFEGNGHVRRFQGNYSEYLQKKITEKQQLMEETKEQKAAMSSQKGQRPERKKKLSYKEQKEWEGIEDLIATLEEKNDRLKELIVEAGSDIGKVTEYHKEQQEVESNLEQAMERWTELSMLMEEIENQK
jgi:ABC transport system ATP-binding/permease protein